LARAVADAHERAACAQSRVDGPIAADAPKVSKHHP
jgi:hypothetical protein